MTIFGIVLLIVGIVAIGLCALADPVLLSRMTGGDGDGDRRPVRSGGPRPGDSVGT
ncbi:hypothetical protein [Sphaerisporangium rufum]|nr:hypothetical protein [Sphaerisporangium rufum]